MGTFITAITNLIYTAPAESGGAVGGMVGWIASYIGAITSNPLLLMFVLCPAIFWAIGAIRRIIRLN